VIINQINIKRIAFFKTKNHAPITTHADAPKAFQVAFERVQSPAGNNPTSCGRWASSIANKTSVNL
jgi:hypothetical protein